VIGQSDPEELLPEERSDMTEFVVMNSVRPVLIVPYAGKLDSVGKRIVVAWDGSAEAARALAGAMPLMQKADLVQVMRFNPVVAGEGKGEEPGADVALYLARHGINVDVKRQASESDVQIGNALLSHIANTNADLLVMGAYGHSRLREWVLGGVTDTILKSMTVPTLMMH
jgi:nucleotide-binding universal stress UspA family protein